jgi:hypothetical protein
MKLDDVLNHHVAEARARGLRTPVIALLFWDMPRDIRAKLDGHAPPPEKTDDANSFEVNTWTVAAAIKLLRRHAGLGGAAVARLLARPPSRPEFWVVSFEATHVAIAAFAHGDIVFQSACPYRRIEFEAPPTQATDLAWATDCAREEMARAAYLVRVASSASLPIGTDDKTVDLPIGDDELALVLKDTYGDEPQIVAAAILRLRMLKGGKDGWLLRVLQSRPELRKLAKPVLAELARWPT